MDHRELAREWGGMVHLGREAGHADILDTEAQQAMGDTGEELALAAAVWGRENTH